MKAVRSVRCAGKFRDLLTATLHHPAICCLLDKFRQRGGASDETMPARSWNCTPLGVGSGYTQQDVEALAASSPASRIDLKPEDPKLKPELQSQLVRDGAFEFNPARHD